MPVTSVGDMSQHFMSMRNGGAIKTELSRLAQSLSTGKVVDVTRALNGDTARLSGMNYSLTQLESFGQAAKETGQTLDRMQTVLGQVDALRGQVSEQLLLINDGSTTAQVNEAARAARGAFESIVNTLNTQVADRALMGGAAVGGPPLASADTMLSDLQAAIGGATSLAAIEAVVTNWFDDPAGGFATIGYLGDTGAVTERRISETKSVLLDARADDPAIKETLKAAAFAALANDVPGLDRTTKAELLRRAGTGLFAASSPLVAIQSRIGSAQAEVDRTATEMNAQRAALEIAKNDLVSADPFDTASRLQSVQLQLETHYTVTARLSQLSLLRYI